MGVFAAKRLAKHWRVLTKRDGDSGAGANPNVTGREPTALPTVLEPAVAGQPGPVMPEAVAVGGKKGGGAQAMSTDEDVDDQPEARPSSA